MIVSLCFFASSTYRSTSRVGSMTAALPLARSPTRYDIWAMPSVKTVSTTMLMLGLFWGSLPVPPPSLRSSAANSFPPGIAP